MLCEETPLPRPDETPPKQRRIPGFNSREMAGMAEMAGMDTDCHSCHPGHPGQSTPSPATPVIPSVLSRCHRPPALQIILCSSAVSFYPHRHVLGQRPRLRCAPQGYLGRIHSRTDGVLRTLLSTPPARLSLTTVSQALPRCPQELLYFLDRRRRSTWS